MIRSLAHNRSLRPGRIALATVMIVLAAGIFSSPSVGLTTVLPVANDDSYSVRHNQVLTVNAAEGVLANDTYPSTTFPVVELSGPANGLLLFSADGSFTYTPNTDFVGFDSFTYGIFAPQNPPTPTLGPASADVTGSGQAGGQLLTSATVTIAVTNAPPVAVDDSYSTPQDTTLTIVAPGVLGNDFDSDGDPLSIESILTDTTHGALNLDLASGAFTYVPDEGFVGTDSFVYLLHDEFALTKSDVSGAGVDSSATVTIEVTAAKPTSTPEPTATTVPGEPTSTPLPPAPTATSGTTGGVSELPNTGSGSTSGDGGLRWALLVIVAMLGPAGAVRYMSGKKV